MELTLYTWIISDTHFGHANIIKYQNRPENHDELMEKNWHELVGVDDTVLHLGDLHVWYRNNPAKMSCADPCALAADLPGRKYLVKGNHDKESNAHYAKLGFEVIEPFVWDWYGKKVYFTHKPYGTSGHHLNDVKWDINVHGHIHTGEHHPDLRSSHLDYRNVSVEVMDYKPWRLKDVLSGQKQYTGSIER